MGRKNKYKVTTPETLTRGVYTPDAFLQEIMRYQEMYQIYKHYNKDYNKTLEVSSDYIHTDTKLKREQYGILRLKLEVVKGYDEMKERFLNDITGKFKFKVIKNYNIVKTTDNIKHNKTYTDNILRFCFVFEEDIASVGQAIAHIFGEKDMYSLTDMMKLFTKIFFDSQQNIETGERKFITYTFSSNNHTALKQFAENNTDNECPICLQEHNTDLIKMIGCGKCAFYCCKPCADDIKTCPHCYCKW